MKLREQRRLRLDDPVGQYVKGLHPQVAEATLAQLLSHSAGLTRDGADSSQFIDSPARAVVDHQGKPRLENIPRDRLPHQPETDVANFEHERLL